MKKLCSVLLGCLIISLTTLSAQINYGFKFGFSDARQKYSEEFVIPPAGDPTIEGLQFSIITEIPFSERWRLQLEPGYIRRGAACEPGFVNFLNDTEIHINYLELPVSIAYQQPIFNQIFFNAKLGYNVAYGLRAKRYVNGSDDPTGIEVSLGGDGLNRMDHGVQGEFGIGIATQVGDFIFAYRRYHGLRDVDPNFISKNRSHQWTIGWKQNL